MQIRLSEKWARVNIRIIGLFYIISGIWECLIGLTELEGFASNEYLLLGFFRQYMLVLGLISILTGFGLLLYLGFVRRFAILLAGWNIITMPLLTIWLDVYVSLIFKIGAKRTAIEYILGLLIPMLVGMGLRIYIIYILRRLRDVFRE